MPRGGGAEHSMISQPTSSPSGSPRPGARVILIDRADRVLLLQATDPSAPEERWWELPGGGLLLGESTADACRRELAEETGIVLDQVGPCVWVRESRFSYKGVQHHRMDWIHPARVHAQPDRVPTRHTSNARLALLAERWWTLDELSAPVPDRIIPPAMPTLLPAILSGDYPSTPVELSE